MIETSEKSLNEANRQLAMLEDVMIEEDHEVPPWLIAARQAVKNELQYRRRRDGEEDG